MKIQRVLDQAKAVWQANTTTDFLLSPLLLAALLLPMTSSQVVVQPIPVYQVQFTSYNDKTLYIRGGLNKGTVIKQFYALDISPLLTYSNNLTWRKLNEVGPSTDFQSEFPMAVDRENQSIYNFGKGKLMTEYNLALGKWVTGIMSICFAPEVPADTVKGTQRAMIDHKMGLVYIPFGYATTEMLVFEPAGRGCSSLPMPPASAVNNYAWSESKNTIYMFGDTVPARGPMMWEFQFASKTWKQLATQGTPPPLWPNNCITSASGGQKLVIFGGTNNIDMVSGEVHIFDTTTYTWTKGAVSTNTRSDIVCASSGDFFIVWGGKDAPQGNNSPAEILFYNMRTDQWIKQSDIVPPSNTTITAPTPAISGSDLPTSTAPGSGNITGPPSTDPAAVKINGAAIAGGVAGVVVLFALVGFLFYRRGKKAGANKHHQDKILNSSSNTSEAPSSATLDRQSLQMNNFPSSSTVYIAPATTTPYNPAYAPYLEPSAPPLASPAPTYTSAASSPYISAASPYTESHGMAGSSYFDGSSGYVPPPPPRPLPTETPFGAYPKSFSNAMSEKTHMPSAPLLDALETSRRLDSGPSPNAFHYVPPPSTSYRQRQQQVDIPPSDNDLCEPQEQDQQQQASKEDVSPTPLQQMEVTADKSENNIEQIRQDQQEELERRRKRWAEDKAQGMQ